MQGVEIPFKIWRDAARFGIRRLWDLDIVAIFIFLSLMSHAWTATAATKTIVFVGDSITAGYGVKKDEGFPERIGEILKSEKIDVKIVNGGISGSVTADADRRIRWYLKSKPDVIVLALGANDGLKGTPVKVIKTNLEKAIDVAKAEKAKVLLAGMRVFENLGADYTKEFAKVFSDLAKEKRVAFIPFLLEGVALDKNLNQDDGKHPNAKGHEVIAKRVAPEISKLLSMKGAK